MINPNNIYQLHGNPSLLTLVYVQGDGQRDINTERRKPNSQVHYN